MSRRDTRKCHLQYAFVISYAKVDLLFFASLYTYKERMNMNPRSSCGLSLFFFSSNNYFFFSVDLTVDGATGAQ